MKMPKFERTSIEAIDFSSSSNWRLTKVLLCILGAWPLQSPFHQHVLSSLTSFIMASMFIPEVLKLITIGKDMDHILICLPNISFHIIATIIIVQLFSNSQTIKMLLLRIREDWQSITLELEKRMIKNDQYDHRQTLNCYIFFMYFASSFFAIMPSLPIIFDYINPLNESRPRIVVYHTEFFLEEGKYEVPLLIHSFIFTPYPSTAAMAFDSIFATSIQHACSSFKIVGKRLQNLMSEIEDHGPKQKCMNSRTDIRRVLVDSIRMHKNILQFVDLLQAAFSTSLFLMNFMSMMNLSMTAYQAISNIDNSAEIVRLTFYTTGQLTRLYFRCWHGQMLINSSESVFDAVYQGEWYNIPQRLRQFIILILVRGKKQTKITAGKVFEMSMGNFVFVVKTASSYVTVLRSMQ